MNKKFTVNCHIQVSMDDVWDYLEYEECKDIEELKADGYKFTYYDWKNTAEWKFENNEFYFDDITED